MKNYYVYILASERNGTLYVGVTGNLTKRMDEHRKGSEKSFTSKYGVKQLVYCEQIESAEVAIAREKQLKNWQRIWKIELIESLNPNWEDLSVRL